MSLPAMQFPIIGSDHANLLMQNLLQGQQAGINFQSQPYDLQAKELANALNKIKAQYAPQEAEANINHANAQSKLFGEQAKYYGPSAEADIAYKRAQAQKEMFDMQLIQHAKQMYENGQMGNMNPGQRNNLSQPQQEVGAIPGLLRNPLLNRDSNTQRNMPPEMGGRTNINIPSEMRDFQQTFQGQPNSQANAIESYQGPSTYEQILNKRLTGEALTPEQKVQMQAAVKKAELAAETSEQQKRRHLEQWDKKAEKGIETANLGSELRADASRLLKLSDEMRFQGPGLLGGDVDPDTRYGKFYASKEHYNFDKEKEFDQIAQKLQKAEALKGSRAITNNQLKFAETMKVNRRLGPEVRKTQISKLIATADRYEELNQFDRLARNIGMSPAEADERWAQYVAENDLVDEDGNFHFENLGNSTDYLFKPLNEMNSAKSKKTAKKLTEVQTDLKSKEFETKLKETARHYGISEDEAFQIFSERNGGL